MMKYKNYIAKTSIEPESNLIYGEVIGPRDVITFQGETPAVALQAFKESVDLYLEVCAKRGREPDKPFSGNISYRTTPTVHRKLTQIASAKDLSVNQLLDKFVARSIRGRRPLRAALLAEKLAGKVKPPKSKAAHKSGHTATADGGQDACEAVAAQPIVDASAVMSPPKASGGKARR